MTANSSAAHAEIVSHHDKVLIVDFGTQVTQLIARRVREAGVYCEIAPFQSAQKAFDDLKPEGHHPVGRPGLGDRRGLAPRAAGDLRRGPADPGICYGQQTTAVQLGGEVEGGHAANSAAPTSRSSRSSALFDGLLGSRQALSGVDEPRRPRDEAARGLHREGDERERAVRHRRRREAPHLHHQFHPEVVHTPDGAKLLANFVHKVAGLRGDWTMAAFRGEAIADDPRAGRHGPGDLRPVGRRRFRGRRRADPRGDRRPADLRVRRPRPDAAWARRSRSSACSATTTTSRWCMWTRARLFLGALDGVSRPRDEAQDHRPAVHRRVRGRGEEDAAARRVPGAGHALSRRDRERRRSPAGRR